MTKRVGVIGGGQLAWMMADAAKKLGIALAIQTPQSGDPAVSIAAHTVLAAIDDAEATAALAQHCDVITFENEFIDLLGLSRLEQQGVTFYPRLDSLAPLLDKYDQRSYLQRLGLPVPGFSIGPGAGSQADRPPAGPPALPVVLKARRHGYDGYGTFIIKSEADWQRTIERLPPEQWLIEEFVPFERELAVMGARSISGAVVVYPVVETQQENQVCRRVIVTAELPTAVTQQVETIAQTLLDRLDYVGVMGIEFFLTQDGRVLVNETAPRTHNSGHYSLDVCETSQFEQQLRAVCGLPLGSAALTAAGAVMVNLLGYEVAESDYAEKRQQLSQLPHASVYWYGKNQSRPGRKLGHVTVALQAGQGREQALALARSIESIWYGAASADEDIAMRHG